MNRRGEQQRFLKGHHVGSAGAANPNWGGGRRLSRGYVLVSQPDHHRADSKGYVPEHVLIAERALGRPLLARHPVHHFDENRANNGRGNLVLCEDTAYHQVLHRRARALAACGDASAVQCRFCHRFDRQDDITVSTNDRRGYQRAYHRACAAAAVRTSREN